ncbi:nucleoside recognition domain-containing protein [Parablautia intestinalis]|uniref:nucleoside recognition domain-containing protein n=1 Tax=Parablautia intestinalis TaxID=2320100 RepID=UPI0026AD78BB
MELIIEKAKGFAKKAFTIIFVASLTIWFLQTFDVRLNVAASAEESLLALFGGIVAPLFAPLGFGDWRVSTALITGFFIVLGIVEVLIVLAVVSSGEKRTGECGRKYGFEGSFNVYYYHYQTSEEWWTFLAAAIL